MSSAPAPSLGGRRLRVGAAILLLSAAGIAACSPSDATSAEGSDPAASSSDVPAPPEKQDHSTTVQPAPLDDAELAPSARPKPIIACDAVGLTVDEVAQIVGVSLRDSEPAAPANSPEMCAYGSHWDDPDVLFDSMKGEVQGSEEESDAAGGKDKSGDQGADASATTTTEAGGDAGPDEQLDSENAVFVAVRPLRKGEDGASTLQSIPSMVGPVYSCSSQSSEVEVPDPAAAAAEKKGAEGPEPLDGVSSLGTLSAMGQPTQIGKPTPTKGAGGTAKDAAGKAAASTQPKPAKKAAKTTIDSLRCDSTPTGSSPHTQTFFATKNALWQVSVNTPGRSDAEVPLDAEAKGLLSLAAFISAQA